MYITVMGMMTMRNMGVAMEMTMMVLSTLKNVARKERTERGRVSSMILTSLEKRLRMRPRGVVSKKDMGERRMLLSMVLCKVLEAKKLAKAMEKEERKTKTACDSPNVA